MSYEPIIIHGKHLPKHFDAAGRDGWFVLPHGETSENTYGPYTTKQAAIDHWFGGEAEPAFDDMRNQARVAAIRARR